MSEISRMISDADVRTAASWPLVGVLEIVKPPIVCPGRPRGPMASTTG